MEHGLLRVGHVVSPSERDSAVSVSFDDRGAEVIWPREIGFEEAWKRNQEESAPSVLIFRDHSGYLTLREGLSGGMSMSSVGSSQQRIRYRSVIETGAIRADYGHINGMSSEIEGLARWAKMHAVERQVEFDSALKSPRVVITAGNLDTRELGGPLALALTTSFNHDPAPTNGVYSISEALHVRTRSSETAPWEVHAAAHHMIQDLMCLVYGYQCRARLDSVMREDDQQFGTDDERRWWPSVYEPTFGRTDDTAEPLKDNRQPLFYLDETDPVRVSNWLSGFDSWSRPTWIAVTTLFQRNSTVEAQLLQVGIALEALGYAIWRRTPQVGGRTPTYERLLKYVTDSIGVELSAIYGDGGNADDWRQKFNSAFKGAKHADNPLPDGIDAIRRAREGFTLIRCWLAVELGVELSTLKPRLDRSHEML